MLKKNEFCRKTSSYKILNKNEVILNDLVKVNVNGSRFFGDG
jgi:hypothetical protein